jgi:hypothetical protein
MAERDAYSPRVAGTPRRPASALLDWNQMRLARRQEDAGVLFAATKVAGRALGSASKFLPRWMVRMRPLLLPAFLAFTAAVLPPNASIGQDAGFGRDADVRVREDSFACRETSELDRLLQRNQSGGFISGVQLYKYLQSHNCIGLSAGRVRVYAIQGQYVCIYDPKDKNKTIRPCAWTRRDMLSK